MIENERIKNSEDGIFIFYSKQHKKYTKAVIVRISI